jgi:hypothetical protein
MAKKTAKAKSARKGSAAVRRTGGTAAARSSRARDALSRWLSNLDDKKLKKLATLRKIVDDPGTCERIPPLTKTAGEWVVKREKGTS